MNTGWCEIRHSGWSAVMVWPSCPSVTAGLTVLACLYQKVTATKYPRLFFLSKLTACCFFSKHESICVFPSYGHTETSASFFKKHVGLLLMESWNLPRNNCQDPLLFSFFIRVIPEQKWPESPLFPMYIWIKLIELQKIRSLKNKNKYSLIQKAFL